MKKRLLSLSLLLTLLLSLGGCKHVDSLTDKIYSIEFEDYVFAMKFLDSGAMGWLVFRGVSNDGEGKNLVLDGLGTKYYFRETEFDITEYDVLRFKKEIEDNY